MSYVHSLSNPQWQKRRLKILERDLWACQLCGDKYTTLHVHHKRYNGNPWDAPDHELVTYCEACHCLVEDAKNMTVLAVVKHKNKNKYTQNLYFAIRPSGTNNHLPDFVSLRQYNLHTKKLTELQLYIFPSEFNTIIGLINIIKNG